MPQFRTKTLTMYYGDGPIRDCQVCWQKNVKFGTLLDPNGRSWLICVTCINTLWDSEQAVNMERRVEEAARRKAVELIEQRLLGEE